MFDKFKKMFTEKDEKRKNENLIAFLIILVITLVVINKILSKDEESEVQNETGVELVSETVDVEEISVDSDLETELENILSKIAGVGDVQVLLTYSETSSISPLYNESTSSSTSTSSDGTTTETTSESKEIFTDSSDEAVIQKYTMPKLEGAIIIAKGASDTQVKTNILEAVQVVTGLLSHKIQVFEMGEE